MINIFKELDQTSSSGDTLKQKVKEGLSLGSSVYDFVHQVGLFSDNEEINDVISSHLRYGVLLAEFEVYCDWLLFGGVLFKVSVGIGWEVACCAEGEGLVWGFFCDVLGFFEAVC